MAGVYSSEEEAKETLKGDRYVRGNLELLNLKTYGFTKYRWIPLYKLRRVNNGDDYGQEYLKHRYNEGEEELRVEYYDEGKHRRKRNYQILFEAGDWSSREEDWYD